MLLRRSRWRERLLPLLTRQVENCTIGSVTSGERPSLIVSRHRWQEDSDLAAAVERPVLKLSPSICAGAASLRSDWGHAGPKSLLQQRYGVATSAIRFASEDGGEQEPVRSPLSQAPGPAPSGSAGSQKQLSTARSAQAMLKGIRQSPKKLNLVAEMVRGMRVEDALTQMTVSVKRAAKTVYKVLHSAQANAVHNLGLEKDRLVVSEAFVGKDKYLKRAMPHGKGKAGRMEHARCRLTVIVKEMSVEKETDLARLRVLRLQRARMSRTESRLVPHRILETRWSRLRREDARSSGL